MIDFQTLGAAELEENLGPGTRPIAVQAKRMALLAYIALAGRGRWRRRDSIVALFWPDLDEEHARSALRQALTYLRRTLGASAILTRGEDAVAVGSETLRCDAVLFDEAIAAGRLENAAAFYRGDFLDGLFVADGSPELEQWIDRERTRLRQAAATCARSLAEARRQRGEVVSAAEWGRRAVSLAPADESTLRWLIGLLDSIGDRAGAVEAYERFARQLASDYAAEPSAETKALMSTVRNRSAASSDLTALTPPSSTRGRTPGSTDRVGPLQPVAAGRPPTRRRPSRVTLVATLAIVVALVPLTFVWTGRAPRATIAVLPTEELGADSSPPYFVEAVTDQLIADLARSRTLQVINRGTMMAFHHSPRRPRDIARELEADAVLMSSVRRSGDSLHLTVQLVRAGDDRISGEWSASGPGGDLLRLTERMADSVAGHTLGRRRVFEGRRAVARRIDPVALDLYAQGRYWWNKRGPGLLRSIGLFTAALDRDPTFALAYAGIADAYVQLGYGSLLRPEDAFRKARAAAERALQFDSTLAEPRATLGFVKMYYDWDWTGAEREFRHALALNASYATAHEWYGLFLSAMGRFDEALEHEHRAQVLDPLSTAVAGTAAWVLYYAGRYDDAERELRIALRADSSFALGRLYLGRVHQARGSLDSALAEYQAVGQLRDWVPTIAAVGHVYGSQGREREALATLARLDSLSRREYVTAYAVALVYASLGQQDSAFAWLNSGLAERTHWMVWLRRDPRWAAIRSDPRFEALASRLGLPE